MRLRFEGRLYLVTDPGLTRNRPLEAIVEAAVAGGVTAVQVREKSATTREFIALVRRLKALLAPLGIPLIVNDRIDVALAAGADGVHVGQDDLPVRDARRLLGPDRILGLSVGTLEQAREAEALDVDYLGVSPVFATPTKTDAGEAWGLAGLAALRSATSRCLVAIGGIHAANAAAVVAAGADGIAVVSALCSASDPTAAARELRGIVDAGLASRKRRCFAVEP